jgi:integrase
MKLTLTQTIVLTKLAIDTVPAMGSDGKLTFKPNITGEKYYVMDDSPNSPTGFGVLVGKKEKKYFIQKRVNGKLIRVSLGQVKEFKNIDLARQKATEVGLSIKSSGIHPKNVQKEEIGIHDITLGEAFVRYLKMLKGRSTAIKKNSEIAIVKAKNRLKEWEDKPINKFSSQEILDKFDEMALKARTSTEQTFRWAMAAVNYVIKLEANDAAVQKRSPALTHNPFVILSLNSKFRTKRELEEHYAVNQVRNPMSHEGLGDWFNGILVKRKENRTGCDFFIITTLWGTRYQEITGLQWRDEITDKEAKTSSWVDMKERKAFLYDTKNRGNHIIPISDGAYELLRQRREIVLGDHSLDFKKSKFVFPARSKFSSTGHYSDATSILKYILEETKIKKLGVHDLRRTFGRMVEDTGIPYSAVKRLLNHRNISDETQKYTEVQYDRLVEYMQKVECQILKNSPKLWNMLMVPKYQPIEE